MSTESWKEEYYPVSAYDTIIQDASIFVILDHGLLKWSGTLRENLEKHNVRARNADVLALEDEHSISYNGFSFGGESCASCVATPGSEDGDCEDCSLYQVEERTCDDGGGSPWKIFSQTNNPQPMIDLLREAYELEVKKLL